MPKSFEVRLAIGFIVSFCVLAALFILGLQKLQTSWDPISAGSFAFALFVLGMVIAKYTIAIVSLGIGVLWASKAKN